MQPIQRRVPARRRRLAPPPLRVSEPRVSVTNAPPCCRRRLGERRAPAASPCPLASYTLTHADTTLTEKSRRHAPPLLRRARQTTPRVPQRDRLAAQLRRARPLRLPGPVTVAPRWRRRRRMLADASRRRSVPRRLADIAGGDDGAARAAAGYRLQSSLSDRVTRAIMNTLAQLGPNVLGTQHTRVPELGLCSWKRF